MIKKENVKVMLLNGNSKSLEIKNPYVKVYDMDNILKVDEVTNEDIVILINDNTNKLPDNFDITEFKNKTLTIGIINENNQEGIDSIKSLTDCYVLVNNEDKNNISNTIDALASAVFSDGLINLDINDIKSVLENSGEVVIEVSSSREKNRLDVVNQIIENMGDKISKIERMIIHFSTDKNISLFEMEDIIKAIREKAQKDVSIIYGSSVIDEEEMYTKITVIASSSK